MSEALWNLIFLLLGAGISFGTAYFLNERSHRLDEETKKPERAIAAREIRLKEGEERIRNYTSSLIHRLQLFFLLTDAKSGRDFELFKELNEQYKKASIEKDRGLYVNQVSIKSLEDEQLTQAFEDVKSVSEEV